jgi:hypothetical protein
MGKSWDAFGCCLQFDHYARMIITLTATHLVAVAGVYPMRSGASIARTTIGYG